MIKVLDKNTINQISAGEVIERPLNVVKELIENSIDANADRIVIEIENGGIDKIIIKDNGIGIDKDDMNLVFTPHATSKIDKISDLDDILTFGFRGEAVASIACVSKVTLITKKRNILNGYSLIDDNGILSKIKEVSANDGTKIIVENLFQNIPARKKFLKSVHVEASKIYDIVEKLALSRKDISFKLVSDGKEKFSTAGNNNLKNIIYTIYGKDTFENVIDVDYIENGIKISGVIGKPQIVKNNRNDEIFFVNGRYVKNDILYKSVEDAYKEYLMQHKFPFLVLSISLDGNLLDVNSHPQKIEIRFTNENDIYDILNKAVKSFLKKSILIHIDRINDDKFNIYDDKYLIDNKKIIDFKDLKSLHELKLSEEKIIDSDLEYNNIHSQNDKLFDDNESNNLFEYFNNNKTGTNINNNKISELNFNNYESKSFDLKNLPYKFIGQIFETYLIFEIKNKIVFVDQHAAHEKINYEKFMSNLNNKVNTQKIMPIILNLNSIQYQCIKDNIDDFRAIGYDIDFFGDKDIVVEGVPFDLVSIGEKQALLEMIDDFVNINNLDSFDIIKNKVATASCKAAIKANNRISEMEAINLINVLFTLDNPYNCPHGRPTMIEMSKTDFDKRFKRIVS